MPCETEKTRLRGRLLRERLCFGLLRGAIWVNGLMLFLVCGFLAVFGAPALSWEFISQMPRAAMTEGGILPPIIGTLLLSLLSVAVSFPLGCAAAIYLHEYARPGRGLRFLRVAISNLAGVPSVVFGLFGMAFFVTYLGWRISIASGVATLAVLLLPIIIGTAEEALRAVPDGYRHASYGLGASKWQTIWHVVLPVATPGLITGAILAVSRAAGETAVILFTAAVFSTPKLPQSIFDSVMALPTHIYVLATAGTEIEKTRPLQYGSALVLILLVLLMNLTAVYLRSRAERQS